MLRRAGLAALVAFAFISAGCELIVKFDRDRVREAGAPLPQDDGGAAAAD